MDVVEMVAVAVVVVANVLVWAGAVINMAAEVVVDVWGPVKMLNKSAWKCNVHIINGFRYIACRTHTLCNPIGCDYCLFFCSMSIILYRCAV